MKERLFPSLEKINQITNSVEKGTVSQGELAFVKFLDENLPDYWKIYWKPHFNGSHPDIVLINPQGGVMIYKVIEGERSGGTIRDSSNSNPTYNKKQLDYYRNKIIRELVPEISEKLDEDQRRFLIFKTGIYMHHMDGYNAQIMYEDYPYLTVVGYDDLDEDSLYLVVPGYDFEKDNFMQVEWAQKLEKWLNPPYHHDRRTGIELTAQQKELSTPKPGHRRLRGPAGSGKTLVIAHRAAKLAMQNKKVLVVTYNRSLWYFIKKMIDESPYNFNWSNITFRHFHGFCQDLLNEFMIPAPPKIDDIVPVLEAVLEGENLQKFKYDCILIDEGQDYNWHWYNFLSNFLTDRNELFLVCDEKQNIYNRELSWIDGKMQNVQFRGRWAELTGIHRLPRKIADLADNFSEKFKLTSSVEFDYPQTTLFNSNESHLRWKNIQPKKWLYEVYSAYQSFEKLQLVTRPSDMVILLPKKNMGRLAAEYFDQKNIPCDHVFVTGKGSKWRNKKISSLTDERLKLSTIHQFKGWESPNVILLIPDQWSGGKKNLDLVVYTAMTRTKNNLIVLNTNDRYEKFGKIYESG